MIWLYDHPLETAVLVSLVAYAIGGAVLWRAGR